MRGPVVTPTGSTGSKRRLAAILAADVVGYSRLMSEHEERTLRVLNERLAAFQQLIPRYSGRIFGGAGDSVIAEFSSSVEAVRCALEIQHALDLLNTKAPEDEQMRFRIGIHVGDIIVEGDNLMGEGVNIAARLESLADPGGINVSGDVYNQVRRKVDAEFADLGPQPLKNIPEPMRTFRVTGGGTHSVSQSQSEPTRPARVTTGLRRPTVVTGIGAILAIAIIGWLFVQRTDTVPAGSSLSIAVLPFANISGDPEQEYFVDGITEDIITDISRLSGLKVIAWNTSSTYKGKTLPPQEIGRELSVAYVLNGSVRKAGDRLRITAQLVDTSNGDNVWAERYDRNYTEVFALQDDVTRKIVGALAVKLTEKEQAQLGHKGTDNISAYDAFLRGQKFALQRTREGNEQARESYRRALELDPTYARAYGALAVTLTRDFRNGWTDMSLDEARARALELAQKAASLDSSSPQVQWALGYVYVNRKQYDEAAAAARQSVALSPNYADGYGLLAYISNFQGNAEDAIRYTQKAMALNPYYTYEYPWNLGRAFYTMGRYTEAIDALKQALEHNTNARYPRLFLAAAYVKLGRQEEAEWEIEQIRVLNPDMTITHLASTFPTQDEVQLKTFLADLRKAGMPE